MPIPHQLELVPEWKSRAFMFVGTALAKAVRNLRQGVIADTHKSKYRMRYWPRPTKNVKQTSCKIVLESSKDLIYNRKTWKPS